MSDEYTLAIERCVPRYGEMLEHLLSHVPNDRNYSSILELGCGTGNLTLRARSAFPLATLHAVDFSADSLDICRARLPADTGLALNHTDMRDFTLEPGSVDLILSSIAIHHLTSAEKRELFTRCYRWLSVGGVFCFADQFRGVSDDVYERHIQDWRRQAEESGATVVEWEAWMAHQEAHDFHDSLPNQIEWLAAAGFQQVDCIWRNLLWCVVQGRKLQ